VTARIESRGYRRYDGPRKSKGGPALSLALHSAQRALGIRRGAATKILPILTMLLAYLPAAAFVGAVALLPREGRSFIPGYAQYYGFISAAIFLFTALVSPELLCPDRRTGMLGLYLTSPLTPRTYVAAKAGALAAILSIVTIGPPLLLTLAYALQGAGPSGAGKLATDLLRIVAAGLTTSAIFGATSLAVSSLTDRRAFASAGIILVLFVPNVVIGILISAFKYPRWLVLFSLTQLPFELVRRIYGVRAGATPGVETWHVILAFSGAVLLATLVLLLRYEAIPLPRRKK
jgi:ABC-2 type transport system permease protein